MLQSPSFICDHGRSASLSLGCVLHSSAVTTAASISRHLLSPSCVVIPRAHIEQYRLTSESFSFSFSLRSNCLVIGLLLESIMLPPAWAYLIRLINGSIPVLRRSDCDLNRVAVSDAMASLSSIFDQEIRRRLSDLLIEVYCTELKRAGCCLALEVFLVLAKKGIFPSRTTCNILLTSLVKANEFDKCCDAFEVVRKGFSPDVYLFTTTINAFCNGGKVDEGMELFLKIEGAGVAPNAVTYNAVMDDLWMSGRYNEAFLFKEKMVENGVEPTLNTYSILFKGLIRAKRVSDTCCILKEMTEKGFPLNVIVYNNLIDGLIKAGSLSKAVEVKDDMVAKRLSLTSSTYNTLIKGYCRVVKQMLQNIS